MDTLAGLKQALARIGLAKLGMMGGAAAATLLLLAWVASYSGESKGLLYAGLDLAESAKIGQKLDEMKIPYEVKGDGSSILVPASQVGRVRMTLAASGLPNQSGVGYELLDQQSPMNMTSFMQRVQRLRALEGEMARTIVTMGGVRTARVHIVLPERESFAREAPKATASVAVTMKTGTGRLSLAQASAIRLLVAGAVPGLSQDSVTVLDSAGIVIASDSAEAMMSGRLSEMKATREQGLQRAVTELLEPLVGRGKVRVVATVDLESAREVSREEKFDPMSQVERSKQLQNDQETSDESKPRDPVSVGQNLPNQNAPQGDGTAKTSSSTTRNGQTTNYEISSIRSERIREPGDVRRMTVAVLVDGIKDASGAFQPRPEEELARFSELVQAGVGFDAKRGDRVTVEAMQFLAGEPQGVVADAEAITPMYSNLPLMLGAALVILLLVGGFLVMQMRSRHKLELARVGGALTTVMPGGQQMVVAAGGTTTTTLTALSPEQRLTALQHAGAEGPISLDAQALAIEDRVEGDPAQSDLPLLALFDLVDSRPDEALAVIRSWIDGRDA